MSSLPTGHGTTWTRSGTWHAISASERGSTHAPDGPNQDAVDVRPLQGAWAGRGQVAAVADGHGGPQHMRSGTGSRIAVDIATSILLEDRVPGPEGGPSQLGSRWLQSRMDRLVSLWHTRVAEDHASRPFTDHEREAGASDDDPSLAYGSTLLVAVVIDDDVLLAQLGDGDVLVAEHGVPRRPMTVDDRLVAGVTTSLCLPEARDDIRYVRLSGGCDLVVLASDGYGNSFADRDWWSLVVQDYSRLTRTHGPEHLVSRLSQWLAESAYVGGDDVSVVVLLRSPGVDPPSEPTRRPPLERKLP